MMTFISKKHIRYDENQNEVVLAIIAVANASELPSPTSIPGTVLHEASGAWDITTGDKYGLRGTSWVKQPAGFSFDFFEEV